MSDSCHNIESCVNNQIVFANILWKDFNVFNNHKSLPFTDKQIDFFLLLQIFKYSFECHFLLNLCHQNGQMFKSTWWSSLQFEYLKMCGHSSPFFISNLGGLVFLLVLQHQAKWQWCSSLCRPLHFTHLTPWSLHTPVVCLYFQQFLYWRTPGFISWIVIM